MMVYRSIMLGQTARKGLPVHDCKYKTARTGLQRQTAKTGLPGHNFEDSSQSRFCHDIALNSALFLVLSLNLKGS
jgi:hypothetical protein